MRNLAAALGLVAALAAPAALAEALPDGVVVSHGISAFGPEELKYPADFAHFDYVNPDAPKGGEIRLRPVIAVQTFDKFNQYIFKGDTADGTQYQFDSLMTRATDEPDALYGLLAESVAMPPDRRFAIFTLRAEARFSSGAPVTAEDVRWSIDTLKERGHPNIAIVLKQVSVSAPAPNQVRFDFAEGAKTRDLPAYVAGLPIFEKAHFEDEAGAEIRDFAQPSLTPPVGSGPYIVDEFQQGRYVVYRLRDDYWAKDLPVNRGQFNFERIRYEYFADHDAALLAFLAGEFDFQESFSSLNWATKYTGPAIDAGMIRREEIPDARPGGTQGWWINTRRDKLSDLRVREALGYVFDFELANRQLFYGLYTRTDSLFENSADLQADGAPSGDELALLEPFRAELPEAVFADAHTPPTTRGTGRNRRNLRAAGRLLDDAGWTVGDDGLRRNANGVVLEVEFLMISGSGFQRIVRPFIENLERVGVKAVMRDVDPVAYEFRAKNFDFDVTVGRFVMRATPGPELRGYLSSAVADVPGSFNRAGVKSPVIDALIERVEGATSRTELVTAARALDRVFRVGHYWVPNWHKGSHTIAFWDRFGRPQDLGIAKPAYDRGVIATWWLDADKSAAVDAWRNR